MARVFEGMIDRLSSISGYDYDFLVDRYNEMIEDGEDDISYFMRVTFERDW